LTKYEIEDIFVADVINQEGQRNYQILHFFTSATIFEITDFVGTETLWIRAIENGPSYVQIERTHFNFDAASNESRIFMHLDWPMEFQLNLRATGKNCTHCMYIFSKYFGDSIERAGIPTSK
jgi:hypothetical protein